MSDLNFSLTRQQKPVTIDGDAYMLVELDGKDRDKYLNSVGARLRSEGKTQSVKNFEGLQASLVTASLRKQASDGAFTELVPIATIQSWPARVVKTLFDAARELSALDDDDGDSEEDQNEKGND